MKDRWRAAPGITYESMVGMYNLPVTLKHIVFAEPLEWEELSSVDLGGDVAVRWLLVIPISDSELRWKLDQRLGRARETVRRERHRLLGFEPVFSRLTGPAGAAERS